jgi:release factor glutamine methyltransferase
MPYGRQRTSVTVKMRNPESRTSPTDCGREGGYNGDDIREYYEMDADLTTAALLADGIRRLTGVSEAPQLDAELLLAHALDVSRTRFRSHPEDVRSAADRQRYEELIARRAHGEPLAYIVGYKEFWSLRFEVSPAVLVPRPETELLVERALALFAGSKELLAADEASAIRPVRVADLGTGSGAIALALAHERPLWQVVAVDVSSAALHVARGNAAALGLRNVEFIQGEWFAPLEGRRFDVILSNPPYVAGDDAALVQPALRFEPKIALTPGADALADLRAIIQSAPAHLERGGWLLLEHGMAQAAQVAHELVGRGFSHVRSHRDLAGHERMTEARWAL